ncbi:MAG TPA: DUF6580 family putative transport protein [Chitinophagales bacterium]|nr:DUF6580 family putative transport protein [Chitinophagales bacterium]
MKTTTTSSFWLIVIFVLAAGVIRIFLSGLPNIAPVAAMALFGGYYFRDRRIAFSLPLLVMFFSDVALEIGYRLGWRDYPGFHPAMPYVYTGFLAVALAGTLMKNAKPLTLAGTSLLSSVIFFIISNFGVWMTGNYPATWEGLLACYVLAIPFFHYTVLGDLFFIGLMFGAFAWVKNKYLALSV